MPQTKQGRSPTRSHALVLQGDGTLLVPLTQGLVAVIDRIDGGLVGRLCWRASIDRRSRYAIADIVKGNGRKSVIGMHRLILSTPSGVQVDHVDGDGLNNRRSNIRICSPSQNHQNLRVSGGTSRFKGVGWCRQKRRWRAQIKQDGHSFHCGYFASEIDAAKAYNVAASKRFGEFACLNDV